MNTDTVTSMKTKIKEMINYSKPALKIFGNISILSTVDKILDDGTECDAQVKEFNKNGMDGLKDYLINNVQYNIP